MVPSNEVQLLEQQQTNITYKIDIKRGRLTGKIYDNLDCVKQSVYLLLRTERYDFIMYSEAYGIELNDLFGKSSYYVVPLIMSRIREAVLRDDRVREVDDFSFNIRKGKYSVSFTVKSRYGDVRLDNVEILGVV